MRSLLITALALATLTLSACSPGAGSPGPEADQDKTPAQIKTEIAQADQTTLEATIEKYQAMIASKQGELEGLETKLKEAAGDALDNLMGEGTTDQVKAEAEELKATIATLKSELEALQAKLAVYMEELNKRLAGG
jgi:peptidoglycan hydrolase CwlO-like protein